jgi:hypothetical protein
MIKKKRRVSRERNGEWWDKSTLIFKIILIKNNVLFLHIPTDKII